MTITVTDTPRATRATASRTRRLTALVRAETVLLLRNRTALANALLLPVVFIAFFMFLGGGAAADAAPETAVPALTSVLLMMSLIFVVFYNVTTAYVARREDRVLQRLLTGSTTRFEALLAPSLPAFVIVLVQLTLAIVLLPLALRVMASEAVEVPGIVNPVLVLLAAVGGTAVLVALAAATAGFSRTVESVQLTTLPVIVVLLPFAGLFPMPAGSVLDTVSQFMPLRAVTDLLVLGLAGTDSDGQVLAFGETFAAAAAPVAVIVVWTVLGALAARRWMRWAPRR